jgi:hypothetical protein
LSGRFEPSVVVQSDGKDATRLRPAIRISGPRDG